MEQMKIKISEIPNAEIQNLAMTFLSAVRRFYEDPKNEAAFQEWKRRKEQVI